MVSRRRFFAELTQSLLFSVERTAGALACATPDPDPGLEKDLQPWTRPPGALPEDAFLKACTRCTDCIDACPHQAIRRLGPEFGPRSGTPAIIPVEVPCSMCQDMACVKACRPQALQLEDIARARMGLAMINEENCYMSQGQPCDYCVVKCPLKGRAIRWNERGLPAIEADSCTGCGVCAYLCPASAIHVVPEESVSALRVKGTE